MEYWWLNILAVFLLCGFLTGILIPQILLIAFKRNLFDQPDARKIHKGAIPRLGGIAFVPAIFFSIAGCFAVNLFFGSDGLSTEASTNAALLLTVFCSLQLLYLVGIADDLIGIRYRAKFVIQILCALILMVGGTYFTSFGGIFGIYALPLWFALPFSAIVIVFLTNAINLIDGIDGLASGLSSIAMIIYGVSFYITGHYLLSMIAFATVGVLVPFFYYNVFGNAEKHSKIFMGDTGSLSIGLLLSVLGISLFNMDASEQLDISSPIILAFSPLIVPCFDVVRVYLYRIRNHTNPFSPDKNHIHHKFLAAGMKQRVAMITIISISMGFTLMNIALGSFMNVNLIILVDVVLWIVFNIVLSRHIKRRQEKVIA